MGTQRPLVFIGSSAEGLPVAKGVQLELDHCAECVIWHQGIFGLSEGNLESLVKSLGDFDFAILVLTPDDLVASRGNAQPAPRDNVLFELGLFIGGLGRERTFMVVDRSAQIKLPSDLAGITPATFLPPQGGTFQSAVGPACTRIADAIDKLGRRNASAPLKISGKIFRQHSVGTGVSIKIKNNGRNIFPPYDVVLTHPKVGTWRIFTSAKSGQLLPQQGREHLCLVHPTNGEVPLFIRAFREDNELLHGEKHDEFVFQLVLEDSDSVLYEDAELGRVLVKLIGSSETTESGLGFSRDARDEFFQAIHGKWPLNLEQMIKRNA